MTSKFWDSSSTLGVEGDGSVSEFSCSRWETEEVPAFPRPFSALIFPKLPRRQRTFDQQEDMIDMMLRDDDEDMDQQDQ
jgi:hypothetical protein